MGFERNGLTVRGPGERARRNDCTGQARRSEKLAAAEVEVECFVVMLGHGGASLCSISTRTSLAQLDDSSANRVPAAVSHDFATAIALGTRYLRRRADDRVQLLPPRRSASRPRAWRSTGPPNWMPMLQCAPRSAWGPARPLRAMPPFRSALRARFACARQGNSSLPINPSVAGCSARTPDRFRIHEQE